MLNKNDEDLSKNLHEAKLKFLRRTGEAAPDSAVVAINSLQRDFELNQKFTSAQREFVNKLIKTSQSLRS